MDLRLKAYLKATGIVLGFICGCILLVFIANGIMTLDFMRENYKVMQSALFILIIVCIGLIPIGSIISVIAESKIRNELQKLKYKEREEYEKQHKRDWEMLGAVILTIVITVLGIMICLLELGAKQYANQSNQSNPSVSTLDIEN